MPSAGCILLPCVGSVIRRHELAETTPLAMHAHQTAIKMCHPVRRQMRHQMCQQARHQMRHQMCSLPRRHACGDQASLQRRAPSMTLAPSLTAIAPTLVTPAGALTLT